MNRFEITICDLKDIDLVFSAVFGKFWEHLRSHFVISKIKQVTRGSHLLEESNVRRSLLRLLQLLLDQQLR